MLEIEIKLPIRDTDYITARLIELGFRPVHRLISRDMYFDNAAGHIRSNGLALRIREVTDCDSGSRFAEVNFKGPKLDADTMSRRESETVIGDAAVLLEVFGAMGYNPVEPEVHKTRDEYSLNDMNACIDNVRGLGYFLELEMVCEEPAGVSEQSIRDEALGRIEKVLSALGYRIEDTITTSYLGLLQGNNY